MKYKLIVLWICVFTPFANANTRYINKIPDFTQTEIKGASFGNGQQFCGPTAVSNSIIWLSKSKDSQADLIKKLASKPYMNTSLKNGTGTKGMLKGIHKISRELFGNYRTLTYKGWRIHQKKYSSGEKAPDINWLKEGISAKSAVWLNIGWYKRAANHIDFVRTGGHWVTLVGHQGKNTLIIHDPAPRAGKHFANEYVRAEKLRSGKLTGKKKGLPISAKGFLALKEGMHIKKKADYAIIDGAIILRL
ncbi:MAG: C39 family peptidase [Pseudomonadales bacterium]|nr:C39 family peptidase [Pseudomonadales bacterium]